MKNWIKYIVMVALVAVTTATASYKPADAGGGLGGGATEVTQIANNAQLIGIYTKEVEQVANQLEQIENQIKQYQNMLERLRLQTENFKKYTVGQWTKAKAYITKIRGLVAKGQELIFTMKNIDEEMLKRFPGYKEYLELKDLDYDVFSKIYEDMSDTMRDTAVSTLKQTQLQYEEFETEESTIAALEKLNDDAEGMNQIAQAGNMMANHQVRQIQKLRMLVMLQNKIMATEQMKYQTQEDIVRAKRKRFLDHKHEEEEDTYNDSLINRGNRKLGIENSD